MIIECTICDGSGKYWVSNTVTCRTCEGKGFLRSTSPTEEIALDDIEVSGKSLENRISGNGVIPISKDKVNP